MAVNAVTRNTKRILILNEELNEQRGMINALLNPRSYTLASADLSTSENQLLSLNAGGYALYGFLRLQADNSPANNTVGRLRQTAPQSGNPDFGYTLLYISC